MAGQSLIRAAVSDPFHAVGAVANMGIWERLKR